MRKVVSRLSWKQWGIIAVVLLFIIAAASGSSKQTSHPAGAGTSTTSTRIRATDTTAAGTQSPSSSTKHPARHHVKAKPKAHVVHAAGLIVSSASAFIVQTQPAPGSCHARGSGAFSRPDPGCTPGAVNPAVTQATINRTICVHGWTKTVRPSESITEAEKRASMAAYGDTRSMGSYEYDHFVPLELGGATNDARNLWPEPGATPNPKDSEENALRREVCDGTITLTQAQHIITTNWVSWEKAHQPARAPAPKPQPAPTPAPKPAPTPSTPSAPSGANGVCDDGTYTYAIHHQGACSHHGGVKEWL